MKKILISNIVTKRFTQKNQIKTNKLENLKQKFSKNNQDKKEVSKELETKEKDN